MKKEIICLCVGKHVPLPHEYISYMGVDLCPTSYYNLLSLLREYEIYNGEPPGFVRKHYSEYVQNLVKEHLPNV